MRSHVLMGGFVRLVFLLMLSPSVLSSNCMTSPDNYYCCNPDKDVCTPRAVHVKYAPQTGDLFVPGYPPEVSGGGAGHYRLDLPSAADAVDWRRLFVQTYWNAIEKNFPDGSYEQCAPVVDVGPFEEWSAPIEELTLWNQQFQPWATVAYGKGGPPGVPSSCASPRLNELQFSIMRYLVEDACPVDQTQANSVVDDSRVCKKKVPIEIEIRGGDSTEALPSLAGPVVQAIILKRKNLPVAGESVSIVLRENGVRSQSQMGTTDEAGRLEFKYVPPFMRSTNVEVEVSCYECIGPVYKNIYVHNGPQMCHR
ncbi:Uncharacterised protein [Delftia tsuruhatensis]|nr:hypothetical protein [Delftia tsuruhatensis]CAB5703227.1 Uncharacterised protein [Delftia tsuruhatensis]CAC9684515.1 Uncharacterised protein [Delftia tsuruhatensis]